MTTDSYFALMCGTLIALLFGVVVAFGGYRFFLVILPIWGFIFGFGLGAQTIQAIFGTGFLSDITSWIVGFVVALIFASLSYLFYFAAVALVAGSLGYALGAGIMLAITPNLTLIAWMIGMAAGIVLAVAVLVLNVQKAVIVVATALLGAGIIVGTFLFMFGGLPAAELTENPVRAALQDSLLWTFTFLLIAGLGMAGQFLTTRRWEVVAYNRWDEPAPTAYPS
jgi:Domain of unknown function (DUF4203)